MNRRTVLPLAATAILAIVTTPLRVTFSDIVASYVPAWQLAHHGTVRVPLAAIPAGSHALNEFHLIHGAYVSDRMPGVILAMVPFSLTSTPTLLASILPAVLCLVATVYLIGKLWGPNAMAVAALASPLVSIDRQLWPQTIVLPLILLGMYRERWIIPASSGVMLCRPPTAFLFIVIVIWWNREIRSTLYAIGGTIAGAIGLLLYTHHYFGRWSLAGGYSIDGHEHVSFLNSVLIGTVSPQRGILFYTPWIVAAFMVKRWRSILIVGAFYTMAEWWQYNAFGGDGYLGYRYPLPLLLLCVGAIGVGAVPARWVQALLLWSIGVNTYVITHDHYQFTNTRRDAWQFPHEMLLWGGVTLCFGLTIYGLNTLRRSSGEYPLNHS